MIYVRECSAYVLHLDLLIYFEFIFVYGVRKCPSFILLQVVHKIFFKLNISMILYRDYSCD